MTKKVTTLEYDVQGNIEDKPVEQVIEFFQKYADKNAVVTSDYYSIRIVIEETEKEYKARMAAEKAAKAEAKRKKDYQKYLELKAQFESECG